MEPSTNDVDALAREKYGNDRSTAGFSDDVARLAAGEPLAYVIGHIPFLGVSVELFSRPLIPRPETEWWTEKLVQRIADAPHRVLDLCAGSGAIGLALLAHCPNARVSFGEQMEEHEGAIRKSIEKNALDASRADIRIGDLFAPFKSERYDLIATNPPYIPAGRALPEEVAQYEPPEALYAGDDGLEVIRRIFADASLHLAPHGEIWMECDIANIEAAERLAKEGGALRTEVRTDQYERPRLLVAYY